MALNPNAQKWVEALRSGEFEQTSAWLRREGKYCCLGVACELYRRDAGGRWESEHNTGDTFTDTGGSSRAGWLSPAVMAWLGLSNDTGEPDDGAALAKRNDEGATFAEIANVIESEPKGLFGPTED